ncbi:acyl CoA binding protein-domain-containing protein, partial [Endogone sp. FLAS-F59071]
MNLTDVDISDLFHSASTYLAEHSSISLSNDAKLKLYAYYKQSTQGDCTTTRPGLFEFVARAKWDAWKEVEGMNEQDAMQRYVETVVGMGCGWDPEGNHREEEAIGEGDSEQVMGNAVNFAISLQKSLMFPNILRSKSTLLCSSDEPHDIFFHVKEGDLIATLSALDEEDVDINEKDYQ